MKQLMLVTLCKNCKFCNYLPLLGKEYYECTIDPQTNLLLLNQIITVHMEMRKMNQHEIMDNMTHEEFETINNKNSSDEEKTKAWNDASKRMENYYGADMIGTKYVSFEEVNSVDNDIVQQLKEQNKILKSIDNHLDKLVRKPIK